MSQQYLWHNFRFFFTSPATIGNNYYIKLINEREREREYENVLDGLNNNNELLSL